MRQQLREPDEGASGPNKRATLTKCLLKKGSWKTALSVTEKGQKAAHQMKSTMAEKKEFLTLTPGDDADGRRYEDDDDDDE
jgi:hypothetical protein